MRAILYVCVAMLTSRLWSLRIEVSSGGEESGEGEKEECWVVVLNFERLRGCVFVLL